MNKCFQWPNYYGCCVRCVCWGGCFVYAVVRWMILWGISRSWGLRRIFFCHFVIHRTFGKCFWTVRCSFNIICCFRALAICSGIHFSYYIRYMQILWSPPVCLWNIIWIPVDIAAIPDLQDTKLSGRYVAAPNDAREWQRNRERERERWKPRTCSFTNGRAATTMNVQIRVCVMGARYLDLSPVVYDMHPERERERVPRWTTWTSHEWWLSISSGRAHAQRRQCESLPGLHTMDTRNKHTHTHSKR